MAYSTTNPPVLSSIAPIGQEGGRTWSYRSSDSSSVVDTSGYITNGKDLGLRVGDYVNVAQRQRPSAVSYHSVTAINSDGSANLSDNLFVTGSADTD